MFEPIRRLRPLRPYLTLLGLLSLVLLPALTVAPVTGQEQAEPKDRGASSGLVLPRFATTRSTPINVRVGPGTKYEVAWIYLKAGVPVEIVQEFDTWRKIRDIDGSEGWVHQNLLAGTRAGYVAADGDTSLRASESDDSSARAVLGKGFRIQIKECDGVWCEVTAINQPEGERSSSYSGYLHQGDIWGVYPNEKFD
ncbi:SH3 domain-containing protein [Devosia sp.]|uniref:SH3 domain-containing protein n=1 Tax=Devosia sp. TaxID=1871048 RepID=UPI003263D22D